MLASGQWLRNSLRFAISSGLWISGLFSWRLRRNEHWSGLTRLRKVFMETHALVHQSIRPPAVILPKAADTPPATAPYVTRWGVLPGLRTDQPYRDLLSDTVL